MVLVKLYNTEEEITQKGLIKTILIAGNGIFEQANSWLGESIKKVSNYETKIYPNIKETLVIKENNTNKIPAEAIQYVIKWYRDITLKTNEEAQINFYKMKAGKDLVEYDGKIIKLTDVPGIKFWNSNIFSYTPIQKNSSSHTAAKDEFYDYLNKYFGSYIETHSHNSMQAFRSGEDKRNSENDGLQLVFGTLNTDKIEMFTWATVRGLQKTHLTPDELNSYIEFPHYEYIPKSGKFIFNVPNIEFDLTIFDTWNSKVLPKPIDLHIPLISESISTIENEFSLFDDYYFGKVPDKFITKIQESLYDDLFILYSPYMEPDEFENMFLKYDWDKLSSFETQEKIENKVLKDFIYNLQLMI